MPENTLRIFVKGAKESGVAFSVVNFQEYANRMSGIGGRTNLTLDMARQLVNEGILKSERWVEGIEFRIGPEDVGVLIGKGVPPYTIFHDYDLNPAASEYLYEQVFQITGSREIPPRDDPRVVALRAETTEIQGEPQQSTSQPATQPPVTQQSQPPAQTTGQTGSPEPAEGGFDYDALAMEAGAQETQFDEVDQWLASYIWNWPTEARKEYRKIAKDYVDEMYYQYRATGGQPVSMAQFLSELPLPPVSNVEAAHIASLANPPKWVDTDLLNAYAQLQSQRLGQDYSLGNLYQEAAQQITAEQAEMLIPGETITPRPPTSEEIALRAQMIANETVLSYRANLMSAGSWDEFMDLKLRNQPIDQYVPPFGMGISPAGQLIGPLVHYVEQQKARAAGQPYDPRDVFLRYEQELVKEGIPAPDPSDTESVALWNYEVAKRAQEGAMAELDREAKRRLADETPLGEAPPEGRFEELQRQVRSELPPMPPQMLTPIGQAAAVTFFGGGARQAGLPVAPSPEESAQLEYENYLRSLFPGMEQLETRERLGTWFTPTYKQYLATAPQVPVGEPTEPLGLVQTPTGNRYVSPEVYRALKSYLTDFREIPQAAKNWALGALGTADIAGIKLGGFVNTAAPTAQQPFGEYLKTIDKDFFQKLLPPPPKPQPQRFIGVRFS